MKTGINISSSGSSVASSRYANPDSNLTPPISSLEKPDLFYSTSNGIVESNNSAMKSKLAILNERINGFEKQMEVEARQRRESEEGRISAIRDAICKLDKTLNAEIKRRVEASKSLQTMFENQIAAVQEKLESTVSEKLNHLQKVADSVNERVGNAERIFSLEREKFQHATEEKQTLLAKDLSLLKGALDSEKLSRQDRETELIKRFGDLEMQTECRFEAEKNGREQKYEKLLVDIEDVKSSREVAEEKFQAFLLEEIASVKNGLVMESQARESADDDIVLAVNHYTKALQDALRLVSST